MLFDPHKPIINRNSRKPMLQVVDAGDPTPLTMGSAVTQALDAKYPDDQPKVGYERFILGTRIHAVPIGETIDLTISEAQTVKDAVAKAFAPGIFGQVWEALDEAAKAPKPVANGKAAHDAAH